ncbi:MAG TPA: two-component regulator propeller domain-containing protein [Chitinophagales bacterium]|nr:two-component regulator propeller domain-containing protein [Chitinophagales bacterium]
MSYSFVLKTTFLVILAACSKTCLAQQLQILFEHFTSENGISSDRVEDITQDKFGFLWIATTDGLNRFDGRSFTVYHHDVRDSFSIPDDVINSLCADSSGRVWAATNGGLCYYDFSDDHFHNISIRKYAAEPTDPLRVYDIACSQENNIWFLTRRHLHVLRTDHTIESYSLPLTENEAVISLSFDKRGNILLGSNQNEVIQFDLNTHNITKIKLPYNTDNKSGFSDITAVGFLAVNADSVWVATWQGGLQLLTYSLHGYAARSFTDEQDEHAGKWLIIDATPASRHQLWTASYGDGLSLFDTKSGVFTQHFHHDPSDSKSLSTDLVNKIFKDAFGTLWVGTNNGLDKYDPMMHQFSFLKIPDELMSNSLRQLPNDVVEDAADSSHQSIWIAVSGAGLFHYNKNSNQFRHFVHEERNKNSLLSDYVYSLINDHLGKLWIGTRDGICTYNNEQNQFTTIHCQTVGGRFPQQVESMIEDHLNRIWITTSSFGVFCYNPATNELICYSHEEANPQSLPENHVFCVFEDHLEKIWAGTQSLGLCRLDEAKGNWKCFQNVSGDLKSLPSNNVYAVTEDNQKHLWVATENGLAMMNSSDESFENYFTADGLCSNDIFGLHPDNRDHLWLATNNGLSDFDCRRKTFKNYSTADGLMTNHLGGAFCINNDGTIYIGSKGGVTFFNPEALRINLRIPPVVITSFKVFDKPAAIVRSGEIVEPIHLSYKQNMVSFNFAALNFTNAEHNHYAYKLEGFDDDWIDCGNKTSATYTNLDGGDYVFRVKGANNDDVWNEEGTSVSIHITPPYWQTWWFYLLVILAVASILYAAYRIRIAQILRLQNIRQRIARDLHDDIGSTLSSISMMSQMGTSTSNENEKPKELFSTISKASRQAMDLMSDIVWSVNPENDKMENIIVRMREYASEILDAARVDFKIETDPSVQRLQLSMDKRKDFFLIYKEAVNNLAKYSIATKATIRIFFRENELHLEVSDNGIGFDSEKKFSGNGLKNMKSRAAAMKGKFSVTSKQNGGTTILISFHIP